MAKREQAQTNSTETGVAASAVISPVLRRHFNILFFLIIATWTVLVVLLIPNISAAFNRLMNRQQARDMQKIHFCEPGPWGELSYTRIIVETPEDFLNPAEISPRETKWFFKGYTKTALQAFIDQANLSNGEKDTLNNHTKWEVETGGIYVYPSRKFVLDLSPEARTGLYHELSRFPENPYHVAPYTFRADMVDSWLAGSELSMKTKLMVRGLLYDRGPMKAFADSPLVMQEQGTTARREVLIKALTRSISLFPKLHISQETDIDALAHYWMKGGKAKDIRPFLRSLAKMEGGYDIDLVHLLPPVPRMLVYTHITPEMDSLSNGAPRNHWTSANFFNSEPDDRFLNTDTYVAHVNKEYFNVGGMPAFGDIIMFITPQGKPIHSCNYIADDIVLTKNGTGLTTPWVFMRLDEVKGLHAHHPFNTLTLRRKET